MSFNPNVQYAQTIRNRATGEVVKVLAMIDPRTKEPIVLWSDVEHAVEGAKSLRLNDTLVPFMKDESFNE
jgi:hypothetical protein